MDSERRPEGQEHGQIPRPRREDDLTNHPDLVFTLLEDDQLVSAKQATHFGRMGLSRSISVVLWALRIYVVLMLVIVVLQVVRALGG